MLPARMDSRLHLERVGFAVTALALQGALYLLLTDSDLLLSRAKTAPAIAIRMLTAARPRSLPPSHWPGGKLKMPRPTIQPLIVRPVQAPRAPGSAFAPPVDWQAAISRAVGEQLSHAQGSTLRFGMPRRRAGQRPSAAFGGWDEVRIHRLQRLGHGIIDVGRCVITLAFPVPICHFGKTPANGTLFKHMHGDRTAVGSLP